MAITFNPRRGAILICDFGKDPAEPWAGVWRPWGAPPEITKVRRAVVVSPDAFNVRQGRGPGLCIVVPVSVTRQWPAVPPYHVPLAEADYRALTLGGWAKCNLPMTVSHDRLSVPQIRGRLVTGEFVNKRDMALIDAALRLPLGI